MSLHKYFDFLFCFSRLRARLLNLSLGLYFYLQQRVAQRLRQVQAYGDIISI